MSFLNYMSFVVVMGVSDVDFVGFLMVVPWWWCCVVGFMFVWFSY